MWACGPKPELRALSGRIRNWGNSGHIGQTVSTAFDSVYSQALFHRVALIPDEDVETCHVARPLWCQLVDALNDNAIDIVTEHRPCIRHVARVYADVNTR